MSARPTASPEPLSVWQKTGLGLGAFFFGAASPSGGASGAGR